ncbi:alcohol dehydrogenase catalytic domain-containing protein [Oceanispirochaeta sp.]|jgi:(R,R)-butanediol dehydrogenase/meso-butanediol dehydrogenase/diacetyl reductase|uniref:zinc-dependent alcohol dehydrogenase n=1 Tax=Oceanispirochaeta sp. TaxID=2035350 RepID=UPI002629BAF5|nr:alcohol dehydrogenase catalytic domain-containing protein [Oceanispirochaeta sp.]MDA3955110.1 alcohol dehydrogenase catalytic domain-containing protein [Oceanispirochaeta sp.]
MKSLVYNNAKLLTVVDKEIPEAGSSEVVIKIAYCGICGTDRHIYHGIMDERVKPPMTFGHEMSGTIHELGAGVTGYEKGQKVTVRPLDPDKDCIACRMGYSHICQNLNFIGVDSEGAFQQYWKVKADILHALPEDMDLEVAALTEPLAVACHDVSRSGLKKGDRVAIIGGGPIGLLIALLAQLDGADVRLLEISKERRDVAEDMGIKTIDSLTVNPVEAVFQWTGGDGADIVFEVSGSKPGAALMTGLARPRGVIVLVGIFGAPAEVVLKEIFLRELDIRGARVYQSEDFDRAIKLLHENKAPWRKVISKVASLEDAQSCFESLDEQADLMKILIKGN